MRPSLTEEDIQHRSKKEELDELRSEVQEKNNIVIEVLECEWWRLCKTTTNGKQHVRETFIYRRSLTDYQLLEEIKRGKLFSYVQSNLGVPESLRTNFACILLIFKDTLVSKNIKGDLLGNYAKEEGLQSQAQKLLISSFKMQKGTLTTPLLFFHLQMCLVVTKIHCFLSTLQRNVSTAF